MSQPPALCSRCGADLDWPRVEYWVIRSEGFGVERGLEYYGPFPSKGVAEGCPRYVPDRGSTIVAVPT